MIGVWTALIAAAAAAPPPGAAAPDAVVPKIVYQLGHSSPITAAAWTPKGSFILTGASDQQVLVWDREGRIVDRRTFSPPAGTDGWLGPVERITVGADLTVHALLTLAQYDRHRIVGLDFSWSLTTDDANRVAPAPTPKRLRGVDPLDDAALARAKASPDPLARLVSPDGTMTLALSRDIFTVLRPTHGGGRAVTLIGQAGLTDAAIAFAGGSDSGDGIEGLAGDAFDAAAQRSIEMLTGGAGDDGSIAVAPNGRLIAFHDDVQVDAGRAAFDASSDYVRLIDLDAGGYGRRFRLPHHYDGVAWIDSNRIVATSIGDGVAFAGRPRTIDVRTGATRDAAPLCFATPLGHAGALVGAGTANCDPAPCVPLLRLMDDQSPAVVARRQPALAACIADAATGPRDGVWILVPDGRRRALDAAGLPPAKRRRPVDPRGFPSSRPEDWAAGFTGVVAAADGRRVAGVYADATGYRTVIWDAASGHPLVTLADFIAIGFDAAAARLVGRNADSEVVVADATTGRRLTTLAGTYSDATISPDGATVVAIDGSGRLGGYDATRGAALGPRTARAAGSALQFDPLRPVLWIAPPDKSIRAVSTRDWSTLFAFRNLPGQRFVVTATLTGRYDSNLAADARDIRWLMPDAPLRSLGPQTFLRNLYTPGLMGRALDCAAADPDDDCNRALAAPPGMETLNRQLPVAAIAGVERLPGGRAARVTVQLREGSDPAAADRVRYSGLYDLRLFRDGRLVAQSPDPDLRPPRSRDVADWRAQTSLTEAMEHGGATVDLVVPLPSGGAPVAFSAYAFNADRIKGETATATLPAAPAPVPAVPGRLFAVAIGVDWTRDPEWRLSHAADDARAVADAFGTGPRDIRIVLTSEKDHPQATRAAIRAVLLALAGRADADERLLLAGLGLRDLPVATPDDAVVISFAGHGENRAGGEFLLLPGDAVRDPATGAAGPGQMISTDDLTAWLRPLDAGQIALIIDACHSAASVDAEGFRPGPLGDPGLGQLAFDKGIRVLAASQAEGVALEDGALRHGLLTYAVAVEGVAQGRADGDHDGIVTLGEALRYGVEAMPALAARVAGAGTAGGGGAPSARAVVWFADPGAVRARVQQPKLFDFTGQTAAWPLRTGVPPAAAAVAP